MDEKTTKMVIIGVVVIAVVAIAAFFLMNNGNGGGDNPDDPEPGSYSFRYMDLYKDEFDYWKQTRLAVLGNANNDTTIDSKDVDFIKSAIKGGDISYKENNNKYKELYMCDANSNGIINSDDVKYVENMIAGKVDKIYYEKLLDGIGSYSPAKKTYLIPVHRCYARTSVMLANASSNVTIVGGCTQCDEKEFSDVIDHSAGKYMSVGTTGASSVSTEAISQLAAKYSDGNVVVMTGGNANYCTDYETKGTHAQYLRFITWEGDALTGLLTSAYLIDGSGNSSAAKGTAWGQAKIYENWYHGYIDKIKTATALEPEKTIMLGYVTKEVNGVTIPGGNQSSLTMRGNNSAENLFVENASGQNIAELLGPSNSYGRVAYDLEKLANVTTKNKLDVMLFMHNFFVDASEADNDAFGTAVAKAFKNYIQSGTDIYVKTWYLNGVPMIMDQIMIAHALHPDNAVIASIDIETVWNEYLDIYGASKTSNLRYDNVALMGLQVYHTA